MKKIICLSILCFIAFFRPAQCEQISEIDQGIIELAPKIGSFPPEIGGVLEQERIEKKYLHLMKLLDDELSRYPGDISSLYKRGFLQYMGNNLGYSSAFKGSEKDLSAVLTANPNYEPALITLGTLYISSNRNMISKAETLFESAQKKHGSAPLEGAQQGLFFVYYYQGKMELALEKARILIKNWPTSGKYRTLEKMALIGIERLRHDH